MLAVINMSQDYSIEISTGIDTYVALSNSKFNSLLYQNSPEINLLILLLKEHSFTIKTISNPSRGNPWYEPE